MKAKKVCQVEGCERKVFGHGLCGTHYMRKRRTGSVELSPDYIVNPVTGCWDWQRSKRQGYGRKGINGKLVTAHRWYYEQKYGPIPDNVDLDHVCHSNDKSCPGGTSCPHRGCVNPDHLEPVTRAINVRRGRVAKKLTQADVDAIRAAPMYWGGRKALAEKYGVSDAMIAKVRSGETWAP